MPVRFNRVAGDSQYGTTPVDVPLHLLEESLGTVRLWLRELPAGLAQELEDHTTVGGDPIFAVREMVRWGVAGHDPNDFLEETPDGLVPIPYQSDEGLYHEKMWRIASDATLSMYEHALPGAQFLHSIRGVLSWYQAGLIPTPRQIWDSAKPKVKADPLAAAPEEAPKTQAA